MMGPLSAALLILSLAGGLLTASLTAAQNDSLEAREIASLLFTSNMVLVSHEATKANTAAVKASLEGQVGRQLSEDEARRLEELLVRAAKAALPRSDLEANYADLLVQHFSPQELKDLAAFYRTPLGAKVLHFSSVTLIVEGSAGVERILKAHERDTQERFRAEFTREFPAFRQELERKQRR
jgi:hypothetical protein